LHRRGIRDVLDLPGAQPPRLAQYVPEQAGAHVEVIPLPGNVEQHEGEGFFRAGQRPEGDPPEEAVFSILDDEAPFRAHRAQGEHALQVLLDLFAVVRRSGRLDGEVEFVGADVAGAHHCDPPAAVRWRDERWLWSRVGKT
jgi:hypothetical protein